MYLMILVFFANLGSRCRNKIARDYPGKVYWGYKGKPCYMPLNTSKDEVEYQIYD